MDERLINSVATAIYYSGANPPYNTEWVDAGTRIQDEFRIAAQAAIEAVRKWEDRERRKLLAGFAWREEDEP